MLVSTVLILLAWLYKKATGKKREPNPGLWRTCRGITAHQWIPHSADLHGMSLLARMAVFACYMNGWCSCCIVVAPRILEQS
ncbi:hypothetical protein B0T22DRAFT_455286 [Podospora appendiculata]|uniref:Uncharacterized protein n=1 Tax=Podospora appendiculata TaxID=314037 RepID=A0AAE0XM42_9PEZI|nr:hypothetical protein B0T22DRAFT_455286 [Podospora appendiculata]